MHEYSVLRILPKFIKICLAFVSSSLFEDVFGGRKCQPSLQLHQFTCLTDTLKTNAKRSRNHFHPASDLLKQFTVYITGSYLHFAQEKLHRFICSGANPAAVWNSKKAWYLKYEGSLFGIREAVTWNPNVASVFWKCWGLGPKITCSALSTGLLYCLFFFLFFSSLQFSPSSRLASSLYLYK